MAYVVERAIAVGACEPIAHVAGGGIELTAPLAAPPAAAAAAAEPARASKRAKLAI